ncbi:MAG: hypothetical protein RL551_1544 [Pseudomonadota bacterium]
MKNTSRLGKMPTWQRHFVLIAMLSCSLTGTAYLLGHELHIQRDVLGAHSVLAWHGITAIMATMALGSVLPIHLKAGLKSKRKLWSNFWGSALLRPRRNSRSGYCNALDNWCCLLYNLFTARYLH